ncbi:hypothetical protein [Vibrio vulnificus]|uniref:hypothetical protein n=1 Tax=Vibrio vulnificus TaxID=672 RepID=UPI001F5CB2B6|nr:hypothetical protein [Vibrio vulnificus]
MKCTACNATFNCFITPKDFIHKNDQFTEPDANQQPELLCAKQRHLNLVKKETQMEKGSKEQPKKKTDNLQSSRYRQDEIEEIERWNRPSASTLNTIFK